MGEGQMPLPRLRADLEFLPAASDPDGVPSFTIHDPLRGTFDKVGWAAATVLRFLRRPQTTDSLCHALRQQTTIRMTREEVLELCREAAAKGLTSATRVRDVPTLMRESASRAPHPLKWLLFNYLYFRVPLLHPDEFLEKTVGAVRWLASPWMIRLYALLAALGLAMLAGRTEAFTHTFLYFFNAEGAFWYAVVLIAVKGCHEFAHAYTAKSFGVRVPTMGLAFIVLWPVPYCDVTDAWRLPDRRKRLWISAAGMLTELTLAGLSLFLWNVAPEGVLKSAAFLLASLTLVSTLAVNLNPAMRFDGYYILSDLWGVDNLQPRAFATTRWALRRFVFGFELDPPEPSLGRRHLWAMIAYSIWAWFYRLGLYLGIAVLVYYKFTKALGVVLFSVEIAWFVMRPVAREAAALVRLHHRLRLNPRFLFSLLLLLGLLAWAALPLPRRLDLPAITAPAHAQTIYAPVDGELRDIAVKRGASVRKEDPICTIRQEALDTEVRILSAEIEILKRKTIRHEQEKALQARLPELHRQMACARSRLKKLQRRRESGAIHAAVDGTVYEWNETLVEGLPVRRDTVLGRIGSLRRLKVIAYLPEADLAEVRREEEVRFFSHAGSTPCRGRVVRIAPVRGDRLPHAPLASVRGGDLPVRKDAAGRLELVESYYRIEVLLETGEGLPRIGQTGFVRCLSRPRSLLAELVWHAYRVILRESNF